jgi:signal transduction histidine kinase/ActR/RegA family two-component response regulator
MIPASERILILTSTQRDSESTHKLLAVSHLCPHVCTSLENLLQTIQGGAGALVLAKEVLMGSNLKSLINYLDSQPSWSELPVIILAGTGDLTQGSKQAIQVMRLLRNTTVLERPVRVATLISVVESAIANRRRQYEVRNLLHDLLEARQEAERANKTKSEFLANMSHEIRTPLGVILGFTEFALDPSIPAYERENYLHAINRNGRILLDLVNDVLDLAKVEAGRIAIERGETSIPQILNEVISGLLPSAASKGISIKTTVAEGFPSRVLTDAFRLHQILNNLIGNAVKFTSQGYIRAEAYFKHVENAVAEIRIRIIDTGIGVSDAQREKLFHPFSQADSSMARKFGGTGLGLVLSRKLAQALNGDLQLLETTPGRGSTFELSLRAETVSAPAVVRPVSAEIAVTDSISGMRVLVADDSVDNLYIISRFLDQAGIAVDTVENGKEAVTKALSDSYDAILMDIQMPLMDGTEATMTLRRKGYRSPIIALTANALKGDREKALCSGFDDYITKPIERRDLYTSLGRFKGCQPPFRDAAR